MNQVLHLYWYSGSGNTLRVSEAFAQRLRELGWTVELRPMENHRSGLPCVDSAAVFGLAFPTHCFSIPETVRRFVAGLPTVNAVPVVMLGTHGVFSGGVQGPMKRMLTQKGFRCTAGRIFCMPDSFYPIFSDAANKRQQERTFQKVRRFADAFHNGATSWRRIPLFSDLFGMVFYAFFSSRKLPLVPTTTIHLRKKQCLRCGVCVGTCPKRALEMREERVSKNSSACDNCLRCVAVCPADAMRHIFFSPYRCEPAKELAQRLNRYRHADDEIITPHNKRPD